jgi:hypothetical protein
MSSGQFILDPIAPSGMAANSTWKALDSLKGKVVGFMDNSKPNFNVLADELSDLLKTKYGVKDVVRHRKLAASIPTPDLSLADIEARCDLVISGSGD